MRYICFNLCADFYSNFAYVIDIGSNFWGCARYLLKLLRVKNLLKPFKGYELLFKNPKYVKHMLKLGYYH